ncbi:MAG TPA: transposase [Acidimicrobiia bacterium]|nr:transposase [Acidimicrobiia bacterium]
MACRAFKFLLSPTVKQRILLARLLDAQRELYNAALEERRGAWRWERRRVSRFEQYRQLTGMADLRPELMGYGVTVARGTLLRLDRAFQAFYRRCRTGATPGFPRFKAASRFDSVEYPDVTCWRLDQANGRLRLHGVGHIKVRLHRDLRGTPKTCTVRREGRRWWVTVFCIEVPARPLPSTGRSVGLDMGVANLVTTSDGDRVDNPRYGRGASNRLAAAQQTLARSKRGSARRRRVVERVAACHRKVRNQRRDLAHKVSRRLVNAYDLIAHEDLQIQNMTRCPAPRQNADGTYLTNRASAKAGVNRSILDAGWGQLLRLIAYKAEEAGRTIIAVDAHHTSQTCCACGHVAAGNRPTQAVFHCQACGQVDHADINAATNILRAGLAQRFGAEPGIAA